MAVVLDASAVLALLNDETGADRVEHFLLTAEADEGGHTGLLSTVNWIEVCQYAPADALAGVAREDSPIGLVQLTKEQAAIAAGMWEPTRKLGLSLADRVCLALGIEKKLTVVTAEHAWRELQLGVTVAHIRP